VDAVERANGDRTATLTFVQVYKAADELHGPLKPLMIKG